MIRGICSVLTALGCGLIFGIQIGYLMAPTLSMFDVVPRRILKREVAEVTGYTANVTEAASRSTQVAGEWLPQTDPQKHPCIPMSEQKMVKREGLQYHPSKIEQEWLAEPHHLMICNFSKKQIQSTNLWLSYSHEVFHSVGKKFRDPNPQEAEVLSAFDWGDGSLQWIEPLHGAARSPLLCGNETIDWKDIQGPAKFKVLYDIRYLITANLCGIDRPRPRAKYYDLGCTSTGGRTMNWTGYDYMGGSGAGPSIPLFLNMYKDRCIYFDDIYGWEARPAKHEDWWGPIPDEWRPKVHYFNVPVVENSCPESPSGKYAKRGSFLRFLQASASVDDFVVVKVDIDGGPELEIVQTIAHRPELAQLVDELYFEYHFEFDFHFGWGKSFAGRTVDTAIDLMHRLRQAGVRSHFWI